MSTLFNIILLVAVGAAGYFMFKKMRGHRKPGHTVVVDPVAQDAYDKQTKPAEDEEKSLTLEERVELSWQFLTNITEQVMTIFSSDDKSKVVQAGETLAKNGMKYQHDVNQEAKITREVVKARAKTQKKNKSMSR